MQDLADKPYKDFFKIECSDENLPAITDALDVIWQNEEGRQLIEKIYNKRGQIEIVQDPSIKDAGIVSRTGVIEIPEPLSYEYLTTSGELYASTMLDTLAHELWHLGDDGLGINLFLNAQGRISFDINLSILQNGGPSANNFFKLCDSIMNEYGSESFSSLSDAEKRTIFEEKFADPAIKEQLKEMVADKLEHGREIYDTNPAFQSYIKAIEAPAIEFANRITEGSQPPRAITYNEYQYVNQKKLQQYLTDDPSYFVEKALLISNFIQSKGSLALAIQEQYKNSIEVLMPLTDEHPTTVLNADRRYHGSIKDILLCDIQR
jgi:hypothetical protein